MTIMHEQLPININNPMKARYFDYKKFTYPWHFHSQFEIIYTRKGSGERYVADRMENFMDGDLVLLGSNVPHYMKSGKEYNYANDSLNVEGVIVQFEKDFMTHAIQNYSDLNRIKTLLDKSRVGLHFPFTTHQKIIAMLELLPTYHDLIRIIHLLLILDEMASSKKVRLLGSPHFSNNMSVYSDNRLEKLLSFITLNYTKDLKLEEVASMIAMNPSAFSRFFKVKTGRTFVQYINDMRIGYACKLLAGKSMNISQIGDECGFNTISHFNSVFKSNTGLTPSEYKSLNFE